MYISYAKTPLEITRLRRGQIAASVTEETPQNALEITTVRAVSQVNRFCSTRLSLSFGRSYTRRRNTGLFRRGSVIASLASI